MSTLKRTGELKRTELVRRTRLRAGAGLKSNGKVLKSNSGRRTAQKSTGPSKRVVDLVFARDGGCCIRCGKAVRFEARGEDFSVQHRRARGRGGDTRPETNLPANLVILCGSATSAGGCHEHVERRRVEARLAGLALRWAQDPSTVPLLTWWGPVYLDNEGRWHKPVRCPECRCDPVLCETDDSGEHCADQSCPTCLHGCPLDDDCPVCGVAR